MELDILMRWLSSTVVTLDWKNEWYYAVDSSMDAREFLDLVGEMIVYLFG